MAIHHQPIKGSTFRANIGADKIIVNRRLPKNARKIIRKAKIGGTVQKVGLKFDVASKKWQVTDAKGTVLGIAKGDIIVNNAGKKIGMLGGDTIIHHKPI